MTDKMDRPIAEISTQALAYLGDCVLELYVRTYLVTEKGLSTSAHLNKASLDFVRATAQARAMERILPLLSEEEMDVFRRGRNIGHTNTPKSATVAEYRNATGMEVLFGWLYLMERSQRAKELFLCAYTINEI